MSRYTTSDFWATIPGRYQKKPNHISGHNPGQKQPILDGVIDWCQEGFQSQLNNMLQELKVDHWDGRLWTLSQLSFWHYIYPGFHQWCRPRHQHPFNAELSVGSACRGICVCLAALCHLFLPELTEVRGQSFDVRKRFLLLAVSHQFTSVRPLPPSVTRSERALCIFRSEQFANSFKNNVTQKELRYRISHHCFSWAVD